MSKDSLKKQVRAHVERERLDERQHSELQELIQGLQTRHSVDRRLSRRAFLAGVATAAGVAALSLGTWQLSRPRQALTPQQLGAEVLRNHQGLKPLDINTSRFEQLERYFADGLDFGLTRSRVFPHHQLMLEGGRYCSLGGVKAAQIVFRTEDGEPISFYQTRYAPDVFGPIPRLERNQGPLLLNREQHRISLWVESGVLMASAEKIKAGGQIEG